MILMAGPPACREHGDRSASTDGGVTGKGALGLHPAVLHGEDRPCWWHPGSDLTRHTHRPSQTPCRAPVALCGVLWAASRAFGLPPVCHTCPLPIGAAAWGHPAPTAMLLVPVPRAGSLRSVLLRCSLGTALFLLLCAPLSPAPGAASSLLLQPRCRGSDAATGARRGGDSGDTPAARSASTCSLQILLGNEGWAEPWERALPGTQDGRKTLKYV